jgi:hypothetical protein
MAHMEFLNNRMRRFHHKDSDQLSVTMHSYMNFIDRYKNSGVYLEQV